MKRESLPLEQLGIWAKLNGVNLDNAIVQHISDPDGPDKGLGIVAHHVIETTPHYPAVVLSVPRELVLSVDLVHEFAKSDHDLRGVLEAVAAVWVCLR